MKPNKYYVYLSLALLLLLAYCSEEMVLYDDPLLLVMEDFTFIPETPTAKQEVNIVYYG